MLKVSILIAEEALCAVLHVSVAHVDGDNGSVDLYLFRIYPKSYLAPFDLALALSVVVEPGGNTLRLVSVKDNPTQRLVVGGLCASAGTKLVRHGDVADGDDAMLATDFFSLPAQAADFERCVRSIEAFGGGDDPEDGLEALAYAIKSDWNTGGTKRRQVIVVWTDANTHPLGYGAGQLNYPQGMARDFSELTAWWGDAQNPGVIEQKAKRLVLFAPEEPFWTTITDTWDNVIHFTSKAGKGLEEYGYSQILDCITNTI